MRQAQGEVYYKLSESEFSQLNILMIKARGFLINGERYVENAKELIEEAINLLREEK